MSEEAFSLYGNLTYIGQTKREWYNPNIYARIHYRESVWEMEVGIPNLSEKEALQLGKADLAVTFCIADDLLFLLFQIGNSYMFETPYEPRLHEDKLEFCSFPETMGAPLLLEFIDARQGKLLNTRMVGLGNILSNNLHETCRKIQKKPFIGREAYMRKLDKVYDKYTTEDLFRLAKKENLFMVAHI